MRDGSPLPSPFEGTFTFTCVGEDGELKWTEVVHNLVTTQGKNDNLDKYLKGAAYTAAWYLLIKGAGAVAVTDTLASHAAWSEVAPYSVANRPTLVFPNATVAGSNTSNAIALSIVTGGQVVVAGAGMASVQAVANTAGILYDIADFTVPRTVANGDTLNVSMTVTGA